MMQYERSEFQPFYRQLFKLYSSKEHKSYVFALVNFMMKYRKAIFMYSKKSFASQFIEILKQGRGVRQ